MKINSEYNNIKFEIEKLNITESILEFRFSGWTKLVITNCVTSIIFKTLV